MSSRRVSLFVFSVVLLYSAAALAGTETVLHNFNAFMNGGNPQANLIADAAGDLYGTASTGGSVGGGVVFKLSPTASGQWKETILHNFLGYSDGYYPLAGLVFDKAGNLYGTTAYGNAPTSCGPYCDGGTVFELSPNADGSWTEKILHTFNSQAEDGYLFLGSLIFDSAGNLYGTTEYGGRQDCGCGIVFKLSPTQEGPWQETILYAFGGEVSSPGPYGGVVFDAAGNLYGTTFGGGTNYGSSCNGGCGTAFELSPTQSGEWTETIIYKFTGFEDGGNPSSGLIFDSAGNLYGVDSAGGTDGQSGVVFELSPGSGGTWVEKTLSVQMNVPVGNLVFDNLGNLFGAASAVPFYGYIFELTPSSTGKWRTNILYVFQGGLDGYEPEAGLLLDSAGNLYGTTIAGAGFNCFFNYMETEGCGTVFKLSFASTGVWKETQLYTFPGTDGQYPTGLISDGEGNFYGATGAGGTWGAGEVFKMSPSNGGWAITSLYSFTGYADGNYPNPVVFGPDGNLYGTTLGGGIDQDCAGVVFQLSPTASGPWKETVLHSFLGTRHHDGCYPQPASLLIDQAGNLYGTTGEGGGDCPAYSLIGCGTIYELSPTAGGTWTETILHTFDAAAQGLYGGYMTFESSGNIIGVAGGGLNCNEYFECGGVAYELSPKSNGDWSYAVIYDFQGTVTSPVGALVSDAEGNLYGESYANSYNCGTIFQLTNSSGSWTANPLYSFAGNGDFCGPYAGLNADTKGNLYGLGGDGAAYSDAVFELSRTAGGWSFHPLYSFGGGSQPYTNLVVDSSGNVYGGTLYGGTGTGGVIFEIQP